MALNGAWRAFARASGGDLGKVAEGGNHLVVCHAASSKVASSPQQPADAPKEPHPPQEQQYGSDAGFAPGNSPRRDFDANVSRRWGGIVRLELWIPHTLGRFYAAGLTVTCSGHGLPRTSLNGVRRRYWRVSGRLTERFGPALVPARARSDGWFTTGVYQRNACAAPRVNLLKIQEAR